MLMDVGGLKPGASSEAKAAASMGDWHRLGIAELHAAYGRGETDPVAVLEHYLQRIETFNPVLRAYVEVDGDGARRAAQESLSRIQNDSRRPLEGVPIAVKSNIAVRWLEQNAGMQARSGIIAADDAYAVERLRNAGAIIVGSLNMHEAAMGATTDNPYFGRCINPHGDGLTPGGSSGGSAAAVAAGVCVAALGTDTLGSIRIPSAYCGVYGLKPTPGSVANHGIVPLSEPYDVVGPIARSMDDLVTLTNVLFTPDLATAMRRSRFMELAGLGAVECDLDIANALGRVLDDLPDRQGVIALRHDCARIRKAAVSVVLRDLIHSLVELGEERCNALSPEMVKLIEFSLDRTDREMVEDRAILDETAQGLRDEIGSNGMLVVPTTPQTAFAQGGEVPKSQADFTMLANVAGLCALSLPVGRDSQGLPIGVQLIGPPHGEAMLIAQARMINDRIRGYSPPAKFW